MVEFFGGNDHVRLKFPNNFTKQNTSGTLNLAPGYQTLERKLRYERKYLVSFKHSVRVKGQNHNVMFSYAFVMVVLQKPNCLFQSTLSNRDKSSLAD